MGPCGKAAAGHEESNHTSGCSYFALLISESGRERSAGFSWINLNLSKNLRIPGTVEVTYVHGRVRARPAL